MASDGRSSTATSASKSPTNSATTALRSSRPGLEEDEKRTLARALNLARRQLNTEQKRELIADQLRETPDKSLRWVAKMLGVHHATVGSVRGEMQSTGEIIQLDRTVGQDGKVPLRLPSLLKPLPVHRLNEKSGSRPSRSSTATAGRN